MKIVHWEEVFHPSFGYQINLLAKYQAKQGHEIVIYTSEKPETHPAISGFCSGDSDILDKKFEKLYNVRIERLPYHRVVSGRVIYKKGYLQKLKKENPDVLMVHTNDTLSAMTIAKHYKYLDMPMVFDNHMLTMASANPLRNWFRFYFRKRITPLIIKNRWTVIRTQDDNYVNSCLGIPKELTPFISVGTDTLLFKRDLEIRQKFRNEHKISDESFVVIYTGKLDVAKNGKLLAETFKEKISQKRDVVLIVVGNTVGEYGEEVEKIFEKSVNRILRFPTQPYTNLHTYYQAADLSVFPQQCSLSFYDAQACGLPVVSEDNNVNLDRVSHGNGACFASQNLDDFRDKIRIYAEMPKEEYEMIRENARNNALQYDYTKIAEKYTKVMEDEINKFRRKKGV